VQKQHISFNTLQLKLSMGENLLDLQIWLGPKPFVLVKNFVHSFLIIREGRYLCMKIHDICHAMVYINN
jgi:hypothetical protein